jgi:pimeloyl-ACP methyl ester carboxylesterase
MAVDPEMPAAANLASAMAPFPARAARTTRLELLIILFPWPLVSTHAKLTESYLKLIHYNRFPKGTHFAAWEQPTQFVDEMRAAFKSLRKAT